VVEPVLRSAVGTGSYVRMYGTRRGTQWGYSLWEVEVYSTPASSPPPPTSAPGPVSSTSPADGATGADATTTLTWTTATNATSYNVYFGKTQSPMPPLVATVSTTSYTVGPLSTATPYFWHIEACNALGCSGGGVPGFTTAREERHDDHAALKIRAFWRPDLPCPVLEY
jgi:endoglucanase